ncbi:hypothetical protein O181_056274 [Austropuccinia psidii MF-1]|uniref:Uncharacterized protein n=1 Tax=Austropuccinia psidii MF-1 TaxID=1389203 RepID=A0A9Q3E895_9BASI|nr:hypothetical protein [Austropuccinia psidii MF-1]
MPHAVLSSLVSILFVLQHSGHSYGQAPSRREILHYQSSLLSLPYVVRSNDASLEKLNLELTLAPPNQFANSPAVPQHVENTEETQGNTLLAPWQYSNIPSRFKANSLGHKSNAGLIHSSFSEEFPLPSVVNGELADHPCCPHAKASVTFKDKQLGYTLKRKADWNLEAIASPVINPSNGHKAEIEYPPSKRIFPPRKVKEKRERLERLADEEVKKLNLSHNLKSFSQDLSRLLPQLIHNTSVMPFIESATKCALLHIRNLNRAWKPKLFEDEEKLISAQKQAFERIKKFWKLLAFTQATDEMEEYIAAEPKFLSLEYPLGQKVFTCSLNRSAQSRLAASWLLTQVWLKVDIKPRSIINKEWFSASGMLQASFKTQAYRSELRNTMMTEKDIKLH